ncbi:MAG TPA: hypothetical protein VFP90_15205 [Gemmatimonadaceae bacterium]|nr:hypothetical protein [Gemmatimonadaceae bacterium]
MRSSILNCSLALAALLALQACSDSVAPRASKPADTGTPPPPPPDAPHTGPWSVSLNHTERLLAVGDSVRLDAAVLDGLGRPVDVPMDWSTSDSLVAAVAPAAAPLTGGWVRAEGPGTAVVVANATGFAGAGVVVTTLPRTSDPPTLVVDDFRVLAVAATVYSSFWYYAPRLRMHDTSYGGGSEVIGVQIEIPGQVTTQWCSTRRDVGAAGREIFHVDPEYPYGYEWPMPGSGFPPGSSGPAVAHLTVRTPSGSAATMTITGPIELVQPPTPADGDYIPESEQLLCG